MEKKKILKQNKFLIIGVVLIISGLCIFIYKNYAKYDYSNLRLYVRENISSLDKREVMLDSIDKKTIINYLKKEKFIEDKNRYDCIVMDKYRIVFDEYELYFDDYSCINYLKSIKDNKTKQVRISKKLKDYVIKLSKR